MATVCGDPGVHANACKLVYDVPSTVNDSPGMLVLTETLKVPGATVVVSFETLLLLFEFTTPCHDGLIDDTRRCRRATR